MLGETTDGAFHVMRIRELDEDDVDGKLSCADEETPPNFSIVQWVVGRIGCWEKSPGEIIGSIKDEIQAHLMP